MMLNYLCCQRILELLLKWLIVYAQIMNDLRSDNNMNEMTRECRSGTRK